MMTSLVLKIHANTFLKLLATKDNTNIGKWSDEILS